MMIKKAIVLYLSVFLGFTVSAQNIKNREFHGFVVDSLTGKGIEYATAQFINIKDKNYILGAVTDSLGQFVIKKIPSGNYKMIVSCLGYTVHKKNIKIPAKGSYLFYQKVQLSKSTLTLGTVDVIAEQKGVKMSVDKTVFIPDSISLAHAKTGLDLLKKAPGVTVRKSDQSIKVTGNSNVLVLVDGYNSYRNINAIDPKDIERIEVIKNPSAKYDSDVANVLNIILKEDRKKGFKASTTLTYFWGENCRSFNTLNLEYEFSKIRIFGMYKFRFNQLSSIKDTTFRSSFINGIDYENITNSYDNRNKMFGNTIQYGLDYYINKNTLLNFTGKYETINNRSNWNYKAHYFQNNSLLSNSDSQSDMDRYNALQNYTLYFRKRFNKEDQQMTFNTNVYLMNRDYKTTQNTHFFYYSDSSTYNTKIISKTENKNIAVNSKLDYSHPLGKKALIDAGTQIYYRDIYNTYDINHHLSICDYRDLRSAFYGVGTFRGKKVSFQAGLRAENYQIEIYDTIQIAQWNYLPNISLLYDINRKSKFKLMLNEKLKYPRFQMLIPFDYYSNDSLSVSSGNPYLKPEKFLNIELNYSYRKKYNFLSTSVFYKRYQDLIGINKKLKINNLLLSKYDNISYSDKVGGQIYLQAILFNGIIQASMFNALYYNYFPDKEYNGWTYSSFLSLEIALPWNMFFLIDASYSGKEYTYNGYYHEKPIIDEISITKSILRDKGEITLGITEFFSPIQSTEKNWGQNYSEKNIGYSNNKAFMLRFNYFFTKGKKLKKVKKVLNMERDDM